MTPHGCYNFALSFFILESITHTTSVWAYSGLGVAPFRGVEASERVARNIVSNVTWFNMLSHISLMLPLKLNSNNYFHMWNK